MTSAAEQPGAALIVVDAEVVEEAVEVEVETAEVNYVGLVTRVAAFAVDAAIINVVAISVGIAVGLFATVVHIPKEVKTVLVAAGGTAYILWCIAYFVTFWSTTGQTPGSRLMGIRVVAPGRSRLPPRRALLRFAGLTLAAIPLFAGYLWILVDDRRRGLQDIIARTVVVEAEPAGAPPQVTRSPARERRSDR